VHQVGPEIVRLHTAGEIEAPRALCKTLLGLKDQILAMLSALQFAVLQREK
jgi:hypothetical protein